MSQDWTPKISLDFIFNSLLLKVNILMLDVQILTHFILQIIFTNYVLYILHSYQRACSSAVPWYVNVFYYDYRSWVTIRYRFKSRLCAYVFSFKKIYIFCIGFQKVKNYVWARHTFSFKLFHHFPNINFPCKNVF